MNSSLIFYVFDVPYFVSAIIVLYVHLFFFFILSDACETFLLVCHFCPRNEHFVATGSLKCLLAY